MTRKIAASLCGLVVAMAPAVHAFEPPANAFSMTLELVEANGAALLVGSVDFEPVGDGEFSYHVNWDEAKFSDQFLSMRPFKCLDGAEKQWCRVPYPYENKRRISSEDLTDLEYDLLFIWKKRGDYGIDMWNGVYYDIEASGDGLAGAMNEMDMDILSAPPEGGDLRPIGEYDLELADPDGHWLPLLKFTPLP